MKTVEKRQMPNYKAGKIYAIRSHQTDLVYIGSTTQPLSKRLAEHKHKTKTKNISSKQLFSYEDVYIELIEDYPCETKEQLNRREGEIIRNTNCVNKRIAGRTKKEHYEDNRETLIQEKRIYEKKNRDIILERRREYREKNRDRINEKKKEYYEANKEKISEQRKERYNEKKAISQSVS